MFLKIWILLLGVIIGVGYYKFDQLTKPLPLPKLDLNTYWGPDESKDHKQETTIKPFKVAVAQQVIDDLKVQLNRTLAYTPPLKGINFEYGFNSLALKSIVEYWRDDYLPRWSEREAFLNGLPQFTTEIKGLRIHFIHAKPDPKKTKGKKVLPLLLLHGWPGSVREFYEFIPMLIEPNKENDFVFEVVAPSLVGYGFSDSATRPGFNAPEMAIVAHNLMQRLGFKKFVSQGGDWGSVIHNNLATIFPDSVLAYHSNFCFMITPLSILKEVVASYAPKYFMPMPIGYYHHFPVSRSFERTVEETGYFHLQATKPDTIGAALLNNPTGLAAYILEKFQLTTGSINQEIDALSRGFSLDSLLDNLMIYYVTSTATTAARFYAENMSKKTRGLQIDRVPSPVPYGCARFLYDMKPAIDWALKDKFPNLVHSSYFPDGGHFAALEVPEKLFKDFTAFIRKLDISV